VVSLAHDEAPTTTTERSTIDPRLAPLIEGLRALAGPASVRVAPGEGGIDAALLLPRNADLAMLALAPQAVLAAAGARPAATTFALAELLAPLRPSAGPTAQEDLLALRRLILDPLLGSTVDAASLSRLRFAATALGFELVGPLENSSAPPWLALIPTAENRPLALLTRASGVRGTVIEAAGADHPALRDVAVRWAAALQADCLIVNLDSFGDGGVRAAHTRATAPEPGRDARLLFLRQSRTSGGRPGLSTWGLRGERERDAVRTKVSDVFGLTLDDVPLQSDSREMLGRVLFGSTGAVVADVDASAVRALSFSEVRHLRERLDLPVIDGAPWVVASTVAQELDATNAGVSPRDAIRTVRDALADESISAAHRAQRLLAERAIRAALVIYQDRLYAVVIARTEDGSRAAIFDTQSAPASKVAHAIALDACGDAIRGGATCLVP
jgi:hypothetical protein